MYVVPPNSEMKYITEWLNVKSNKVEWPTWIETFWYDYETLSLQAETIFSWAIKQTLPETNPRSFSHLIFFMV